MILVVLSIVTLGAAAMAAFVRDIRQATLALWVAGIGVGGIFLTVGAETLAIVQWIICTLAAISFIFFAVMFGEYGSSPLPFNRKRLVHYGFGLVAGVALATIVQMGGSLLPNESLSLPTTGNDLAALGQKLSENDFLSLEVLGLTLLMVLIGGGVIARPESESALDESRMEGEK